MIYGYARVSTKGQQNNGFSLEQQENEIKSKYSDAMMFKESYTGTTLKRPVLDDVLGRLADGDMLVVTRLDRLARNTKEGISIIEDLFERKVSVHVLNVGLLEDTSMGRFFLTTLLAIAEMERSTIIERTQAGKEIAKTKDGFKEGRPKQYTEAQIDHAMSLLEEYSYTQVVKMTKISKSTLIRERRKRKLDE